MGVPSLTLLKEPSASLIWKSLTPEMLAMRCRSSTAEKWLPREAWRDKSTLSKLKLMPCSRLPGILRRSPRRLWLMLPVLLMSLELNRIMPLLRLLTSPLAEDEEELLEETFGRKLCRALKYTSASIVLLIVLVLLGIFLPFEPSTLQLEMGQYFQARWTAFKTEEGLFETIVFLMNSLSIVGLFLLVIY